MQPRMTLADRLKLTPPTFATRARPAAPKGWEPGVKFTAPDVQEITTEAIAHLDGEPDFKASIEAMGLTVPDGYRVRIAEMKYDPAAWHRDEGSEAGTQAYTAPIWRYRFICELAPVEAATANVDGIATLNALKRSPKPKLQASGPGALIININDTQVGKDAGGGTDATLERVDRYLHLAQERIRADRDRVGELVILLGGDLVEGCDIFPNQEAQLDRDHRGQVRDTTGLLLDALDRLAPSFQRVRLIATPGNHGERRKNGKRVNRHDNADQLVAEAAATAAGRDQALQHVDFNIAFDQAALTADIQGHILALTHGSVYGKSGTGSPALKAYAWFKNMAAARHPVGDAQILVGNHFHHDIVTNFGNLLFVQNPAMDGGSPEFSEYSGTDCAPGMSTWIMTERSRFTGYEVLR
jgi:hypothetical protein